MSRVDCGQLHVSDAITQLHQKTPSLQTINEQNTMWGQFKTTTTQSNGSMWLDSWPPAKASTSYTKPTTVVFTIMMFTSRFVGGQTRTPTALISPEQAQSQIHGNRPQTNHQAGRTSVVVSCASVHDMPQAKSGTAIAGECSTARQGDCCSMELIRLDAAQVH